MLFFDDDDDDNYDANDEDDEEEEDDDDKAANKNGISSYRDCAISLLVFVRPTEIRAQNLQTRL